MKETFGAYDPTCQLKIRIQESICKIRGMRLMSGQTDREGWDDDILGVHAKMPYYVPHKSMLFQWGMDDWDLGVQVRVQRNKENNTLQNKEVIKGIGRRLRWMWHESCSAFACRPPCRMPSHRAYTACSLRCT